jgi:hypothetical protein
MNLIRKEYETRSQKQIDFVLGVVILIAVNVLFSAGFIALTTASSSVDQIDSPALYTLVNIGIIMCSIGPLIVNVGGIIVLAIYRRWMAFGMLATLGALFVVVMCLGVILLAACGASLSNI